MKVELKVLDPDLYNEVGLPAYATLGACAVDLRSTVNAEVKPGECIPIRTGIAVHCGSAYGPDDARLDELGLAALVLPRSGLGSKQGLVIGNLVGLIDEDYQGEIIVSAWNRNETETGKIVTFQRGERIAQMLFMMVLKPELVVVQEFSESTERREGGHGSTGRF
jgi:dUTP pyrophosphatase